MSSAAYNLRLQRTVFDNLYRAILSDENHNIVGYLRVIPVIPTDPSLLPEDAPREAAYLQIMVDDANINKDNLIDFEERATYVLLKRFSTEVIAFQHCQFYYPSPAFVFEQPDAVNGGAPMM